MKIHSALPGKTLWSKDMTGIRNVMQTMAEKQTSAMSGLGYGTGAVSAGEKSVGRHKATVGGFGQMLKTADAAGDRKKTSIEEEAMDGARQLVATALLGPVLEEMRKDPFRVEMFHGGQGEDMFMQQMNVVLADRIVKKSNLPVVDAVYRTTMKKAGISGQGRVGIVG